MRKVVKFDKATGAAVTSYQVAGANCSIKSTTPTTDRTIVGAGVSTRAPNVIF